jgi:protein disulfide-isomerase
VTRTDLPTNVIRRFIKHYSPTCGHCRAAAPIWREVANHYESTPIAVKGSPGTSFTETYGFRFGSLNCLAYGDLCGELDIARYPMFIVYKDGKKAEAYDGPTNDFENLSKLVDKWVGEIQKEKGFTPGVTDSGSGGGGGGVAKLAKKANANGHSIALDADVFTRQVLTTGDPWFIKLYAPWCGHCQAMAPAWAELGKEMQGVLNIGEVNCEVEKRLCKDLRVGGYPTVLFFKNGERVEYEGLRGLGDLVSYARRAVESDVKEIDDATFRELERSGEMEVAFIYFYDQATTSEDFAALERLTLELIGHAPLFKTNDDLMALRFHLYNRPRLMVVRDGNPSYYTPFSPHELRDRKKVLDWMRSVWLPILPELAAANSHQIMNNRMVVLGILSREKVDEFSLAKKELKEAAIEFMEMRQEEEHNERKRLRDQKQIRIDEAEDRGDDRALSAAKHMKINVPEKKEVGFAWVDGVFWERWVKSTYGVSVQDGARIIINDEDVCSAIPPTHSLVEGC